MPATFSRGKVARSDGESSSNIVNDGRRILVGAFPIGEQRRRVHLVVLHDLSFVDARSGQAQALLIATLGAAATAVAGSAAIFVIVLLRDWMRSLRRAIDEVRSGSISAGSPRSRSAIDAEIKRLLGELEGGREAITRDVDWSPTALHELLHKILPDAEILIVSNREPYIHNREEGRIAIQMPASGLVSVSDEATDKK